MYLATWTLKQVALDASDSLPIVLYVPLTSFYNDDFLLGGSLIEGKKLLQTQIYQTAETRQNEVTQMAY